MDDLTRISGIGKATAARLASAGVDSFARLALYGDDLIAADDLGIKAGWIAAAAAIHEENIEGSSGTAREASSTDIGTTAEAPIVGAQPGSQFNTPPSEDRGGGGGDPAVPARNHAAGTIVRIRSKREGFRRCGIAHPKAATDHHLHRFTPAELERLLAEPMLIVELA